MFGTINLKDIWLIPNLITISRIALLPLLIYFLSLGENGYWESIITLFVMALSDILDGNLARRLNQVSDLGKMLDPVADKIDIFAVGIALVLYREFPLWLFIIFVTRDILFVTGGILLLKKKAVGQANVWGKLTMISLTLLVFCYLIEIKFFFISLFIINLFNLNFEISPVNITIIISLIFLTISVIMYAKLFLKLKSE